MTPESDAREVAIRIRGGVTLSATLIGGSGAPFVFVHGWMGDRRWWEPVASRLAARGHAVVLYDQRGHGRSSDAGPFDMETLAADLAALLEQLDLKGAVVAGHSMGGVVAQLLTLEHADLVRRRLRGMVLVSTACDQESSIGWPLALLARATLLSGWMEKLVAHPRLGRRLGDLLHGALPADQRIALREMFLGTRLDARRACWSSLRGVDVRERLAAVDLPTLVVVGAEDTDTPPASSERIAAALARGRFERIAGATHALPWEAPDRLADLFSRFSAEART